LCECAFGIASGDRQALSPSLATTGMRQPVASPPTEIAFHRDLDYKMSFDDAELLKEFVVESQEHLSDVENQLLTLESQGDAMDVALVNAVFRAVHSIKGAAGFMGLETLQSLAHREEEVLVLLGF